MNMNIMNYGIILHRNLGEFSKFNTYCIYRTLPFLTYYLCNKIYLLFLPKNIQYYCLGGYFYRSYVDTASMFETGHLSRMEITNCLRVRIIYIYLLSYQQALFSIAGYAK